MNSKNKKLLYSFITYCNENPSQRFWQALTNWSGKKAILSASEWNPEKSPPWDGIQDMYNVDDNPNDSV